MISPVSTKALILDFNTCIGIDKNDLICSLEGSPEPEPHGILLLSFNHSLFWGKNNVPDLPPFILRKMEKVKCKMSKVRCKMYKVKGNR